MSPSQKGFFQQRPTLWAVVQALIISGGVWASARLAFITIVHQDNGQPLTAIYTLSEDSFLHPRLQQLRRRENLGRCITSGATQFDKIILLRKWVHQQWQTKMPFYYPPWDAVEILDLSRQHHNNGFCAQYAIVFLQACQSMGIHARYLDMPGHFAAEVWSDDYNQWVFMDPTEDVHYEKNGAPLDSSDLCSAYWNHREDGIWKVGSDKRRVKVVRADLEKLRQCALSSKADQLTHPLTILMNGVTRLLKHEADYHRYPLFGRDKFEYMLPELTPKISGAKEEFTGRQKSDDRENFSYRFNQALLFIVKRKATEGLVKVILHPENSPTFENFLLRTDQSNWEALNSSEFFWRLKPGLNHLSVRIRTRFGWLGPVSSATVFYKPNLFALPHSSPPASSL